MQNDKKGLEKKSGPKKREKNIENTRVSMF